MVTNTTSNGPAKKFKVLGVNDDADNCECCGKAGLKRVVWIENLETGSVQHFGVVCAANPAKAFGLDNEIAKAIRENNKQAKEAERAEKLAESIRETTAKNAAMQALYTSRGGLMKNHTCSNGLVLTIPADAALMQQCWNETWKK